MNQDLFDKMYMAMSESSEGAGAFPWAAIIQAVMSLLGGCSKAPTSPKDLRDIDLSGNSRDSRYLRFGLRSVLRENDIIPTRKNLDTAVDGVLKAREKASDSDLNEILESLTWGI